MGQVTTLQVYRDYLEAVDEEAQKTSGDEEYLDLLTPDEVIDLLCVRDRLDEFQLDADQKQELARLDNLLIKHYLLVAENIEPSPDDLRSHWWWRLHEGPQVREQALASMRSE